MNKKEKNRRNHLERNYGLSLEHYETLLKIQKYRCIICKMPVSIIGQLVVDHDHDTGKVRGLLCKKCNLGLGQFDDSPKRILRAALYICGKERLTAFLTYVNTVVSKALKGGLYW